MSDEQEQRPKKTKTYIILGSFVVISVGLFLTTIIEPSLLIGFIWDWDIEQKLIKVNQKGLEHKPSVEIKLNGEITDIKMVQYRLVYDYTEEKKSEVESRIERAVGVYQKIIEDPAKTYVVRWTDNEATLEMKWRPSVIKNGGILVPKN